MRRAIAFVSGSVFAGLATLLAIEVLIPIGERPETVEAQIAEVSAVGAVALAAGYVLAALVRSD